jgi:integrase
MKVTKREGRGWVVDGYVHGRRVVRSFKTKREAEDRQYELEAERKQNITPRGNPFVTVAEYAPRFLSDCREADLAPRTLLQYEHVLNSRIIPALGKVQLRELRRSQVREFLESIEGKALRRQSLSVLSGLLSLAVEDELVTTNVARGVQRRRQAAARVAQVRTAKAMTRDQRDRFLEVARDRDPVMFTAACIGFLAGLRGGEVLGLRWADVDLHGRRFRVHRQLAREMTKSGAERMVEIAAPLAAQLKALRRKRAAAALQRGAPGSEMEEWVVYPSLPSKLSLSEATQAQVRFRNTFGRILKLAELPPHFTPHSMRHTYCSLLIAAGVSPVYVQQQAGHADVSFTVRVYGSWLPAAQPGALVELAEGAPLGEPVTNRASTGNRRRRGSRQPLAATGTCGEGVAEMAITP